MQAGSLGNLYVSNLLSLGYLLQPTTLLFDHLLVVIQATHPLLNTEIFRLSVCLPPPFPLPLHTASYIPRRRPMQQGGLEVLHSDIAFLLDDPQRRRIMDIQGPPWPPKTAALGETPTKDVDIPICAVFLALFIVGAVGHMTLFQLNNRRGHKFLPSAVTFGFCMSRIVANCLRIAWACYPHNIRVAIASQIFIAAGVLLLFIINLLFAQRILGAFHPRVGSSVTLGIFFKLLYVLIVLVLAMLITSIVQSFYTLNSNTHRIDRDLQLGGMTFFMAISFLPFPILAYVLVTRRNCYGIQRFGTGGWPMKFTIVAGAAFFLCLGASFRAGTMYKQPQPKEYPAWYDDKACLYVFDFTLEIIVVYIYLIGRVDLRFYVPNSSREKSEV